MRFRMWWMLALCLMLAGCGGETTPAPEPEEPSITVAPVEGDVVSPDGRWELLQSGANEGITAGGLYPSEQISLVNRETGELLWSEDGAYETRVDWRADSAFAVVARTARTWTQVQVVSTETGESCAVLLPGEEPIPDYTFLEENWIKWPNENSFELYFAGTDGVEPLILRCTPSRGKTLVCHTGYSARELLAGEWDLTHDGQPERVELVTYWSDDPARPDWLEVAVSNGAGELLWETDAATQHIGWCSIFACTLEERDYLLRYDPYAMMGTGSYHYQIFSLTPEGTEVLLRENGVTFDLIDTSSPVGYDVEEITAFLEEVHGYLDHSTLLLSTQGGTIRTGIPGRDYDLDDFTGVEGDTWREKVEGYRLTGLENLPG